MRRIEFVQPDRRGDEREGEPRAARRERAEESTEPNDGEAREREAHAGLSGVEQEEKPDRDGGRDSAGMIAALRSRQARSSMARRRRPSARCKASAVTSPHSAVLTKGLRVKARKSRARRRLEARSRAPGNAAAGRSRARCRRADASSAARKPRLLWVSATPFCVAWPRAKARRPGGSRLGGRGHAEYTAKAARSPRPSSASANAAMARSSERPRQPAHSTRTLRKPDRRMDRGGDDEQRVEGRGARDCDGCAPGSAPAVRPARSAATIIERWATTTKARIAAVARWARKSAALIARRPWRASCRAKGSGASPSASSRRSHKSAPTPWGRSWCSSYGCGRIGSRRGRRRRQAASPDPGRAHH